MGQACAAGSEARHASAAVSFWHLTTAGRPTHHLPTQALLLSTVCLHAVNVPSSLLCQQHPPMACTLAPRSSSSSAAGAKSRHTACINLRAEASQDAWESVRHVRFYRVGGAGWHPGLGPLSLLHVCASTAAVHAAPQRSRRAALAPRPVRIGPCVEQHAQQAHLVLLDGPNQRPVWRGSRLHGSGNESSAQVHTRSAKQCQKQQRGELAYPCSVFTWIASLPRSCWV